MRRPPGLPATHQQHHCADPPHRPLGHSYWSEPPPSLHNTHSCPVWIQMDQCETNDPRGTHACEHFIPLCMQTLHLLRSSCSSLPHTAVCPHIQTMTESQTGLEAHKWRISGTLTEKYVDASQWGRSSALLTIVIHSAMNVKGSEVEAFSESMAIPDLSSNKHRQQTVWPTGLFGMLGYSRFTSSNCWFPDSLTMAFKPRIGEKALSNLQCKKIKNTKIPD